MGVAHPSPEPAPRAPGYAAPSTMPSLRPRLRPLVTAAVLAAGLWLALAQGTGLWLPPALQPVGHALYRVAFWVTLPVEFLLWKLGPPTGHHRPAWYALPSSIVTATILVALGAALRRRPSPSRASRHVLLVVGLPLVVLVGTGFAWGVLLAPQRLVVQRYEVPIRDLPPWAEGLRILHVSDTHYGPYVSLPYLREVAAAANREQADLVVFTGDYVHRTPAAIPDGIAVLAGFTGRLGAVAVLGNHEHWEGAAAVRAAFEPTAITLLDRQVRYLGPEGLHADPAPARLVLAGLGDRWEDRTDPRALLAGVPDALPRILLAHNPDDAEDVPAGLRVDLLLAGHTHGGQVRVPFLGTPVVPASPRFAGGLCRGPRLPVLVSRGVGLAYLPVRLGVPPEVGVVTLVDGGTTPGAVQGSAMPPAGSG